MATSSEYDWPLRLLRGCVFMLAAGREEWGRAMLAELVQIGGRRRRWAFALGCLRCLAFTMPPSGAERVVVLGAWVGAVTSLSVVAAAFLRYPGVVSGVGTWVAVLIFAAVLLTYVVGAVNIGARIADTRLMLACTLAGALIAASWLGVGLNTAIGGSAGLADALIAFGSVMALALGYVATARSSSSRIGVGCIGLTALTAGFAVFLTWEGWTVIAAGRPYDAGLLRDFGSSGFIDLATYAVNDGLGTGMVLLVLVPLLSAASGLAGAAAVPNKWTNRPT